MTKIIIDKELCIGCGTCDAVCGEYFKVEGGEKAKVIKKYDEADKGEIKEAEDSCPVGAISVTEE